MARRQWLKVVIVFLVGLAGSPVSGQGGGGQLLVTAPQEFCTDATHLLELRLLTTAGTIMPVVRVPAGPSLCRWNFEGLPVGDYDALIETRQDDQIVAMARGQVVRGGTSLVTLESIDVEVEGVVTANGGTIDRLTLGGRPMAEDLHLVFASADGYLHEWNVPLKADGTFRVKLDFYSPAAQFCVRLLRAMPLNQVTLRCGQLSQGVQRFDLETDRFPPGVIHVDVPPLDGAAFDAFVSLSVSPSEEAGGSFVMMFKALRGIHGDYLAGFGEHELKMMSADRKSALASSRITLSPDRPSADVKLTISAVH